MKHWDGFDAAAAAPARLSWREQRRLERLLAGPRRRRPQPPHISSLVGMAVALGVLAGLAWALAPVDPVSAELMR